MPPIDNDSAAEFQRSTRMPLDAVVRLHFEGTVAYQNGFAANVSASGMYVKHPDPPPVGTRLVFEFAIGSQRKPVQGGGEVVWSRSKYEGPGRPAGAGISFVDLDELSRQHLAEALFEFLEASLGDRVGEHPEVRAIVASRPTHAPIDSMASGELLSVPPEASETVSLPRSALQPFLDKSAADKTEPGLTPFRIFDDDPDADGAEPEASPTVRIAVPAKHDRPWTPPPPPEPPLPIAGVAVASDARGGSRGLMIVGAIALVAALGAVAWWFFLRSPAPPPTSASAVATPVPAPPDRPTPPPLDPQPGPGTTLAESIGQSSPAPETPLPPAGRPDPEPEVEVEIADEPAPVATVVAQVPAAPSATARAATGVDEIRSEAVAGGTRVTVRGNGGFPTGRFSWSEIGGDKPRVLVKLRGIERPYRGASAGPTAELAGVRVGYHVKSGGNELHVVLDLPPGSGVKVETVEPVEDRLEISLSRR